MQNKEHLSPNRPWYRRYCLVIAFMVPFLIVTLVETVLWNDKLSRGERDLAALGIASDSVQLSLKLLPESILRSLPHAALAGLAGVIIIAIYLMARKPKDRAE